MYFVGGGTDTLSNEAFSYGTLQCLSLYKWQGYFQAQRY